ncbi:MAG: hypothetical protein HFG43_02050 [Lachnospiraceae bacterium]|nr:hypothetical protein [Lachnospiraceae bacterium]
MSCHGQRIRKDYHQLRFNLIVAKDVKAADRNSEREQREAEKQQKFELKQ